MNNQNNDIIATLAKYSATLTVVENSIGSILHAFHIPFSGHIMSINQIAILSRATCMLQNKKACLFISFSSSMLKSLSPAGKKLTPMLAISAQGFLYYIPLQFLGINYFSLSLSIVLSSLWAFFQNVLGLFLLVGAPFYMVVKELNKDLSVVFPHADQIIVKALLSIILIKIFLTLFTSFWYIKISNSDFEKIQKKIILKKTNISKLQKSTIVKNSLRELFNPLYIISILILGLFFYYNQSTHNHLIYYLVRPIGISILIFYFFKIVSTNTIIKILEKMGLNNLSKVLELTLININLYSSQVSHTLETIVYED